MSLPALGGMFAVQEPGGEWYIPQRVDGVHAVGRLASSVDVLGDLNGDGFSDYVLGAWGESNNGLNYSGSVYVINGISGMALYRNDGQGDSSLLGWTVRCVGDVDSDGIPDYGASHLNSPAPTGVSIFSGASGTLIYDYIAPSDAGDYGKAMDGVGDWNGDGVDDFAVGAAFANPNGWFAAGSIFVYSGSDGALIQRMDGLSSSHQLGTDVRGGGDVNGDGKPDILVWTRYALGDSVEVYSGGTGALIYRLNSLTLNGYFGSGLAFVGDLDSDGCSDYVVGAGYAGSSAHGEAYLFSGKTGTLLHTWIGEAPNSDFGGGVANAGDMDGDGLVEIAIGDRQITEYGHGTFRAGKIYVYSSSDYRLLWDRWQDELGHNTTFGQELAGGLDVNGDGRSDLLVGDQSARPGGVDLAGSAFVFSLDPYLDATDRQLSSTTGGTIGFSLNFPAAESGFKYRFLASTNILGNSSGAGPPWLTVDGVSIPLVRTALTYRFWYNPPACLTGSHGILDPNGDAVVTLTLPPGAAASEIGRTFRFAAVSITHAGQASASSSAVLLTIVP